MTTLLQELILLVCFIASGMTLGFCAGGFYGTHFGSHGGHGLGDLAYLFQGAFLGGLLGLALGVVALRKLPAGDGKRFKAGGVAVGAGAAVALVTYLVVKFRNW